MASEQRTPRRRGFSVLGPAILIALGIIFLLNSLNILPWSIWGSLWRFWPVILILIGVEIILGRSGAGWAISLAMAVVLVAVLVGLVVAASQAGWVPGGVFPTTGAETGPAQAGSINKDLAGIQEGQANIDFGAGRLESDSLSATSDKLVVVDYTVGTLGRVPQVELEMQGRRGVLSITGREDFRFGPRAEPDSWTIHLNRGIPMDLTVRVGAAEGSLDFRDLKVRTLKLDIGASSVSVRFPTNAGTTQAFVNAGAASLTLEIPPGVGARIAADSGLASINATSRFSRSGNTYTTQDYQTAANRLDVELKAGVSSVSIK